MEKLTVNFETPEMVGAIFANREKNIEFLSSAFGVRAVARDNFVRLIGAKEAVIEARNVIRDLVKIVKGGRPVTTEEYQRIVNTAVDTPSVPIRKIYGDRVPVSSKMKFVRPQTPNQKKYLDAIRKNDAVIAIGPAGTGKTYLATAMAVSSLLEGEVKRLILTRPALEAGEKLGFLPGDLYQKILPYLRPIYDALHDMMEAERIRKYEEEGVIEVAPLAFMRGRTLNNAFVVLDEAQNTTPEQMKMFMTRLGFNSKMVITGDITQIDLPRQQQSGLIVVRDILGGIENIGLVSLTGKDVVRHPLVQKIVRAYEKHSRNLREK